jgi:hypothetical protein
VFYLAGADRNRLHIPDVLQSFGPPGAVGGHVVAGRWRVVLDGVLLAVLTGPVAGAEISGAPVRKTPSGNAAYYDWTGIYIGGHVGYSRGKAQSTLTDLDWPRTVSAPRSAASRGVSSLATITFSPRAFFSASKQTHHS